MAFGAGSQLSMGSIQKMLPRDSAGSEDAMQHAEVGGGKHAPGTETLKLSVVLKAETLKLSLFVLSFLRMMWRGSVKSITGISHSF